MNIIQKIRAEIERRMDKHWEGLPDADAPEDDWTHNELCELGAYRELEHLETFLSTLEESEKPSEGLEEAAEEYASDYPAWNDEQAIAKYAFKRGAEWQAKRFEENRLAACKNMTQGEYEKETEFVDNFIKEHHRLPTISDAIELTREQMEALGTVVKGAGENSIGSIAYNLKELYEELKKL